MVSHTRGAPPEILHAGPLLLRRVQQADAEPVARSVRQSLEHLRPWMPWATPAAATTPAQEARCAEAVELWERGSDFIYHAFLPDLPGVVGSFGLHGRVGPHGFEIGYWVHAVHAGRGYATHAARALTTAALAIPAIETVEIRCDESNYRSAAIPRKLEYRYDRSIDRPPAAPAESGKLMIWVKR